MYTKNFSREKKKGQIVVLMAAGAIAVLALLFLSVSIFNPSSSPLPTMDMAASGRNIASASSTPVLVAPVYASPSQTPAFAPSPVASVTTSAPSAAATDTLAPASATPAEITVPSPAASPALQHDGWVETTLAGMSLEQKIGQMILSGVNGGNASPSTCAYLREISPGGVLYRAGNVSNPEQLRAFSAGLQTCAQENGLPPLLIALDHEGQYVNRFESSATLFPAAMALGAAANPQLTHDVALAQGQELAYAGVNMVLGPVADVLTAYDSTVISLRSFGEDPQQVAPLVSAMTGGFNQAGLIPVLKHFPGHGGVGEDSHEDLPVDLSAADTISSTYLPPFRSGIDLGAPVVMLGHVVYPALDSNNLPATLSVPVIRLLREDLGFKGVILTDSMGMGAIKQHWTVGDASLMAVQAGVDMLLLSSDTSVNAARTRLLSAVQSGELAEGRIDESVRRILALKASLPADSGAPDWDAHRSLAFQAGYQAVAILRNEANLVPLPANSTVLAILPGDAWGLAGILTTAFSDGNIHLQIISYPPPWDGVIPDRGLIDNILAQSSGYDLTLVMTWEAHLNRVRLGDDWQARLVDTLIKNDRPLMVAALKSPTDLLEFPRVTTYLATFGTASGQLQALIDILAGSSKPTGKNPLLGMP